MEMEMEMVMMMMMMMKMKIMMMRRFLLVLMLVQVQVMVEANTNIVEPLIFNFGDSNSDTGGCLAGLGQPIYPPYGRAFNGGASTGRLSDGRLILDFLCESVNTSLVRPYLEALGSNFENGANFAVSGSTVLPRDVPFALNVQIRQFLHFKARSFQLALASTTSTGLINEEGFRNAVYMIDIGQNDLAFAFSRNLSYAQVLLQIPLLIAEIKDALKNLYEEGGRKFWIHNTGPLGCLPYKLWEVQPKEEDVDTSGCISAHNSAAQCFNKALLHLCQEIKSEMVDATLVYVDIYSIKYDIISNPTTYGFSNPLRACCGGGGPPYNYDQSMICGHPGSHVCTDGTKYISWDGVHYTEAANGIIAQTILSTLYSTPRVSFHFFCQYNTSDNHIQMGTYSLLSSEI